MRTEVVDFIIRSLSFDLLDMQFPDSRFCNNENDDAVKFSFTWSVMQFQDERVR